MIESELAGAELAAALEAGVAGIELLELSESSRGRLVDLAVAAERVKAWAAAVQAAATVALVEQFETAHEAVCARDRMVAHEQALEATALSLSLALGVSMRAADHKLVLALGLEEHPSLAQALAAGRVDEAQARVINDHTAGLSPAHAARLVASVVADPADPANGPDAGAGLVRELRDGTRTVWSIPAHQLRFDLAAGHLTGGAYGLSITTKDRTKGANPRRRRPRRTTLINLTSAETTILGVDNTPATLHTPTGDVPIPAELARALAHDRDHATWRRILCDPATGTATDVSPTYQPNGRIAEHCRVRDGHTSRFPTSAARTLELDHIQPYNHTHPATGGQTTGDNLGADGKRDHQDKTDHLITITGHAGGTLTYATGTGHHYPSIPHQYLDPDPDPPPDYGDPPF
jgi:hypothetical protein